MKKRDRNNLNRLSFLFFKGFTGSLRIRKLDVVPNSYQLDALNRQQAVDKAAEWVKELNAAKNSHYYWWWAFLKESEEYWAARQRRKATPEVKAVAKDFGDIGQYEFGPWWFETGRYLFAQQRAIPSVKELNDGFTVWNSKNHQCIYLEVPLAIRRSSALREINKILGRHFKAEDGGRHNVYAHSTARREVNKKSKMRLSTFAQFYAVWHDRKQYPESEWWKTGEKLKISPAFTNYPHTPKWLRESNKRNMTLTVQRIYRKTKTLIHYAARGEFPRVK